jgi:hypothetical protein
MILFDGSARRVGYYDPALSVVTSIMFVRHKRLAGGLLLSLTALCLCLTLGSDPARRSPPVRSFGSKEPQVLEGLGSTYMRTLMKSILEASATVRLRFLP